MLLKIYFGTIIVSFIMDFFLSKSLNNDLKRKGYKFIKEKKSFSEKFASFISNNIQYFIPGFNVVFTLMIYLFLDEYYEKAEEILLRENKIYKPNEEEIKIDENTNGKEKSIENNSIYTVNVKNTKPEKKYEEMSIEEKIVYLDQEKEKLIDQMKTQVEKPIVLRKTKKEN